MRGTAKFAVGLVLTALCFACPAFAVSVTNIRFAPLSPANLDFGEDVDFTFDYEVDQQSLIFGRPFYNGALRSDYAAHPSPFYSAGMGTGSGFFTILDSGHGVAYVDQVRFQIFGADSSVVEQFVPVNYTFGNPVPEPTTFLLMFSGLIFGGLLVARNRALRSNPHPVRFRQG